MIRNAWVETVGNVIRFRSFPAGAGRLTVLVRDILPLAVSVQVLELVTSRWFNYRNRSECRSPAGV